MRINKFVALSSGLSRRAVDQAIQAGRVRVNAAPPQLGQQVTAADSVSLDGQTLRPPEETTTIMLNKPTGYVCSRVGQGSKTIYDLLPPELHNLKAVGRLDKDSSGLLLLTNDGALANELTHPSHQKVKVYQVSLDKPLTPADKASIKQGIAIEDYISHLRLKQLATPFKFQVSMSEGKNRQIRRTFSILGYQVLTLHRTNFGEYSLDNLKSGAFQNV